MHAYQNVLSTKPPHKVLRQEFLVHWQNRHESDNTWVSKTALGEDKERWLYFLDEGYLDEEEPIKKPR